MSENLQRIGTPLLDVDGLATTLHIKGVLVDANKTTGEEIYSPFVTVSDLEKAGGEKALVKNFGEDSSGNSIPVNRLALAYKPPGMPESEYNREKINDSQHLQGHPADYFYTANQGAIIEEKAKEISSKFSSEVSELRAQYVQLMNFLAKKGFIDNYKPWAGYYDTFRDSYPIHQKGVIATAFVDSSAQNLIRVKDEEVDFFHAGDYVIVVDGEDPNNLMSRKILQIDHIQGSTIFFAGYTGFAIKANQTRIFRTLGRSYHNMFIFGAFDEKSASAREIYTGLDDDNFRIRRKITADNTGFATTFRINPSRADGASDYYLAGIEISAKKVGSPGDLKCYIINAVNIMDFETIQQARDDGLIIAESQPLSMENRSGETIVQFDFSQEGQYPILENIDKGVSKDSGKTRFCMIIEALTADSSNYYEILFLQHYDEPTNTLTDLQLNNVTYEYSNVDMSALSAYEESALKTDDMINKADMFYGIRLRPVEEGLYKPFEEGIYSTTFKTYEPIAVNNAKLTMRVAREGIFTVTSTSAGDDNDVPDNGTIKFKEDLTYRTQSEQSVTIDGFAITANAGEKGNRKIVVGTHVTEIESIEGDKIVIKKGAHIEPGDPVYPMSYSATLTCSHRYWDEDSQQYKLDGEPVKVDLEIVSVQPYFLEQETNIMSNAINSIDTNDNLRSNFKNKLTISDNLIFEAPIDTEREFNNFDLQVHWRMMASKASVSFAGKIHDLSVSLDRKVY